MFFGYNRQLGNNMREAICQCTTVHEIILLFHEMKLSETVDDRMNSHALTAGFQYVISSDALFPYTACDGFLFIFYLSKSMMAKC